MNDAEELREAQRLANNAAHEADLACSELDRELAIHHIALSLQSLAGAFVKMLRVQERHADGWHPRK